MPRGDKREVILRAVEHMFHDRRFHEVTLDEVAQAAHVGKGTIYTYFRDKDDLFFQVAVSGFEELCDLLRRRVADDATFRDQLCQACEAISAFFKRRKHLFRMIQSEEVAMASQVVSMRERWKEKRRRLVEALGEIIRRGQVEGMARGDLAPETLASLLLGLLRTRARTVRDGGQAVPDETLVDFFLKGAGRSGPVEVPGRRRSQTHDEERI